MFLHFLLEDFLNELFSGNEEKVIKVIDDLPVFGVVHDFFAVLEKGSDFGGGSRGRGWHLITSL